MLNRPEVVRACILVGLAAQHLALVYSLISVRGILFERGSCDLPSDPSEVSWQETAFDC